MRALVIVGRRVMSNFGVRWYLLATAVGRLDRQHQIDAIAEL
jgi:hypothetical protein